MAKLIINLAKATELHVIDAVKSVALARIPNGNGLINSKKPELGTIADATATKFNDTASRGGQWQLDLQLKVYQELPQDTRRAIASCSLSIGDMLWSGVNESELKAKLEDYARKMEYTETTVRQRTKVTAMGKLIELYIPRTSPFATTDAPF